MLLHRMYNMHCMYNNMHKHSIHHPSYTLHRPSFKPLPPPSTPPQTHTNTQVDHFTRYGVKSIPQPIAPHLLINHVQHTYDPIVFFNDFWTLRERMISMNTSVTEVPMALFLHTMSQWKWQLYNQVWWWCELSCGGGVCCCGFACVCCMCMLHKHGVVLFMCVRSTVDNHTHPLPTPSPSSSSSSHPVVPPLYHSPHHFFPHTVSAFA